MVAHGEPLRDSGGGSSRHSPSLASVAVVTLSQRTDALVRGLLLLLRHHGAEEEVCADLERQIHAHLDSSVDETVWMKRGKYALTYPLSKYLRNEPPPQPDVPWRPSGVLRRWMKPRLSSFNRKNTHLWYSWLQAKRSTLPVSDDLVDQTYEKHLATLTKVDKGDEPTIDLIFDDPTFQHLLHKVRDGLTKRLGATSWFDQLSASNSACFERTRGKGGQHGELLALAGICALGEGAHGSELHSMRCDPVVYGKTTKWNVVSEVRCAIGRERWGDLWLRVAGLDLTKTLKCTIQAVLEPMKVRVISKGESLPYYTCRPLQRALHSTMRELAPFRLIGRPFSPTDMLDLKERASPTDSWFSVDYSAATDGLSWKYSGRIFRFLCGNLDPLRYDLAMAVLGPHSLHYPVKGGKSVEFRGVQQNGQLMGSILSFPILCLANIGVYLAVNRWDQDGWTHDDRLNHVLVNGDDMVYAADQSLWKRHVEIAAKVGLEMSVGKAYLHPTYANVNSTSILLSLEKPNATPWQIPYLNTGLFYGQHKVQDRRDVRDTGKTIEQVASEAVQSPLCSEEHLSELYARAHLGQDPAQGLSQNLNVLLSGCLPGRQRDVLGQFLTLHADELRRECAIVIKHRGKTSLKTRNLFLPLSMGGMGVLAPIGHRFRTSSTDQWIASACLLLTSAPRTGLGPLPGYPLTKLDLELAVPWVKPTMEKEMFSLCCGSSISEDTGRVLRLTSISRKVVRIGVQRYGTRPGMLVC